jgi:hypothetical protein
MALSRAWMAGVFLLISVDLIRAQESVTQETNPPSLKWYQINTPNFKVLYPNGFEVQAQRMANTLEQIRTPESASMGVKPRKISVILQNQSSLSNAFVTLAPRRSEFYTMPSQNYNFVGNNDWLTMLASHEYRHVVQFQRSLTGFNRFFYGVFGQQALAGLAFVAAPQWFWEGDAVATETAFTHSGRGRIPNFDLVFRMNLLEGRTFNYHKQYLRSYKNNIPNHYVLGYHMVSYLRKKTGDPRIWEKIVGRSWNFPFIPFTFSNAIKKETGLYVTDLYKEMAAYLTSRWKQELVGLPVTPFERVNPRSTKAYTDYLYPQVLDDGRVVAQKSGIGDIEQLVLLNNGNEEGTYVQGPMNATGMMSGTKMKVVWNEYRFDPRWQVRTYSVVKGFNFLTRRATIVSTGSRYAAAALSPDGNTVATVETGSDYQTRLVLLSYNNGNVLKLIPNPTNDFISMPHWTDDGKSIVALKTNKAGKTISRFDVETGTSVDLLPISDENVGYPVPVGKYIIYNSPYSGIDNIYALDTESGKRFQVTSSRYASYNPAISRDGKTMYYNEQARDGMDVVRIPFDPGTWRPLEEVKRGTGFYQHLVDEEARPHLLDSVSSRSYPTQRYHRASGMINVHSWGPYFTNGNLTQAQFGIYSQDILSTTSVNAGYLYDINERTGSWQAGASYQGFYPILDFQILKGNRQQTTSVFDRTVKFNWQETGTTVGVRVPLILTRSKYLEKIDIGNTLGITQVSSFGNAVSKDGILISQGSQRFVPANDTLNYVFTESVGNGQLFSNFFSFTYTRQLKQSSRDFNPKYAQQVAYENYSTPYGGDFAGRLWTVRGLAYFPGLLKHHSLYFRGGYQSSLSSFNLNTYTFRNRVFKPRGYTYPVDNTFYSLSANYSFPVWYPDVALGPVLNIQRVKLNVFYDYGQGEGKSYFYNTTKPIVYYSDHSTRYQSTGLEMTFDVNILRLLQQLTSIGFRASYIQPTQFNKSGVVVEFLIGNIPF